MMRYRHFLASAHAARAARVGAAAFSLACAGLVLAVAPARAACVPNGPAIPNGATVTCTGADVTGVGNGTQNSVTVTVQSSATVTLGNNSRSINLNDNAVVTNNGTVTGGSNTTGITANNNGVLTNAGLLSGGDTSQGFEVQNGNTVTNTANGAITMGVGMFGVAAQDGNRIVNNGAITGGAGSIGISVGNSNSVTNNGTITIASTTVPSYPFASWGIVLNGTGNAVANNGTITIGDAVTHAVAGIVDQSGGNTITNNGTLTVGGNFFGSPGFAIGVGLNTGTVFTNTSTGILTVGANGDAIRFNGSGVTIVNNGTIAAGANGWSLFGNQFVTGTTVNNAGTLDGMISLKGSSTVDNSGLITISNAGTPLAAGNFSMVGTFTQMASGILGLRVNNAGAADTLNVNGSATLSGALRAVLQPGLYATTTTYLSVLTATNPITTTFASAQAFAPGGTAPLAFYSLTPTYNANSVDITLRVGFGTVAGETLNQRRVGAALDGFYSPSLTGSAATFYSNLLQATSVGVLDQLSGEGASATQNAAFLANDLFNTAMANHALAWRMGDRAGFVPATPLGYAGEPPMTNAYAMITKAPPAYLPSWRAWGTGFGGGQSTGADAGVGAASVSNRAAGGAIGLDHQIDGDLLIGVGVGGSRTTFSVPDRATSGSADAVQAGAYVVRQWGSFYAMGLGSYAHFDNRTTRTIAGVGPTETANGTFGSDLIGGKLEIGNTFTGFGINLTPFAAIQAASLRQAGYTEASTLAGGAPGMLGLTYQPVAVNSLPTFLGLQFDTRMAFANGIVWSPYLRAAWVHEFSPARTITAGLTTLNNPIFTVDGAHAFSDAARIDLGSELAITRNVSLSASFNGEISGREQVYSGTGALRIIW